MLSSSGVVIFGLLATWTLADRNPKGFADGSDLMSFVTVRQFPLADYQHLIDILYSAQTFDPHDTSSPSTIQKPLRVAISS